MRKGLVVVGIIVLIIGVLLAVVGLPPAQSETLPAGGALEITPSTVGSDSVTVAWSGASDGTTVSIAACESGCQSTGGVIASSTGASGSVSATLTSGTSYAIFETGSSGGVSATVTQSGISILTIIGIVVLIVGLLLLVLGARSKPKMAAPAAPEPEMTAGVGTGMMGQPNPDVQTTAYEAPTAQSGPVAGTARANLVCTHCGTVNEPWITNCRQCKRPLANTGK